MSKFGVFKFNKQKFNAGGPSYLGELDKANDTIPVVKVEFIDTTGAATDISDYYESGAVIDRIKERAPDELQAGDFDITFFNHDGKFSEYVATSLLYGIQYHGAKLRIYQGFRLSDGSTEYRAIMTALIDELFAHPDTSKVTFRCRDLIKILLDEKLHERPSDETSVAGDLNVGHGRCSQINTLPFKTVNEDWTLTCDVAGADNTATFTVVGSVSGNIGHATSGVEFSSGSGAGGIKFTLSTYIDNWVVGDKFTFSTHEHPEWTLVNPAKIIWSILTGYNWDSNTQEVWASSVFDLDPTQSTANDDINYQSFVDTVASLTSKAVAVSGYTANDEDPAEFIQGILILFLGALFTDGDGKVFIKATFPTFGEIARNYADSKKVTGLGYNRSINEVINYVTVKYKLTSAWEFSDVDVVYDGEVVGEDTSSEGKYGTLSFNWSSRWYSTTGDHAADIVDKLLAKYAEPPLVIKFDTGLDGMVTEIGDRISITDTKYNFADLEAEVSEIVKDCDARPYKVSMTARRDDDIDIVYGFLGSSADESDGLSPQSATYGGSSETDRLFCYLGAAGTATPDYRMF